MLSCRSVGEGTSPATAKEGGMKVSICILMAFERTLPSTFETLNFIMARLISFELLRQSMKDEIVCVVSVSTSKTWHASANFELAFTCQVS